MLRCTRCTGWVPGGQACPNCVLESASQTNTQAWLPRWLKRVGAAVGSGALGMTLAACYGAPCATGAEGYDCSEEYLSWKQMPCEDRGLVTDPDGQCVASVEADESEKDAAAHAMNEGIFDTLQRF